jgi:hypothetical protein
MEPDAVNPDGSVQFEFQFALLSTKHRDDGYIPEYATRDVELIEMCCVRSERESEVSVFL